VNIIFRHYIVHPAAEKLAEAANCVGELAGAKAFYKFLPALFDLADKSDAAILDLAKSMGAKESAFTTCLSSGKHATDIANSSDEGRTLFGISGTPGSVIIDNTTNTFTVIPGAYPLETFTAGIDKILGK
jgi:protein-disulfide isomerase